MRRSASRVRRGRRPGPMRVEGGAAVPRPDIGRSGEPTAPTSSSRCSRYHSPRVRHGSGSSSQHRSPSEETDDTAHRQSVGSTASRARHRPKQTDGPEIEHQKQVTSRRFRTGSRTTQTADSVHRARHAHDVRPERVWQDPAPRRSAPRPETAKPVRSQGRISSTRAAAWSGGPRTR